MSAKGASFYIYLARGGVSPPCLPVSYATANSFSYLLIFLTVVKSFFVVFVLLTCTYCISTVILCCLRRLYMHYFV